MSIVLEGKIKYRKGKKWKVRYCILLQVPESKGILELYIVKDPADFHLAHHQHYPVNENSLGAAYFLPRLEKKMSISSTFTTSSESAGSIITSLASIGSSFDPNAVNFKPLTFIDPVVVGAQGSPSRLCASQIPSSQIVRDSPPAALEYIPGNDRTCTQSTQLLPACKPIDIIYGFESGKHIDNEGSVIVLIGLKSVHCMGLHRLEEMFHWADILKILLKDTDSYYHVKLIKTSDGSRLSRNTLGSLHVQPGRLCFIAEPAQGNKFICSWSLSDIQNCDFDQTGFKITANKASGKGRGTHHFVVDSLKFDEFCHAWQRMNETYRNRQASSSFISSSSAPTSGPLNASESPSGCAEILRMRGTSDGPLTLKLSDKITPPRKEASGCLQRPRYMSDVGSTIGRGSSNIEGNYLTLTQPRLNDQYSRNKPSESRTVNGGNSTIAVGTPTSSNSTNRFCGEGIFATDEDFEELEKHPTTSNAESKSFTAHENQQLVNKVRSVNHESCHSHQRFSIDTAASSGYSDAVRSLLDQTSNSCVMSSLSDQLGHHCINYCFMNDNQSTLPQSRHSAPGRPFYDGHVCREMDSWSNNDNRNDPSCLPEEKHQYYYRRSNSVSIRYQGSWTKENILGHSAKYTPQLIGAVDKVVARVGNQICLCKGSSQFSNMGSLRRSYSDSDLRYRSQQTQNTSQSNGSYTLKDNRVMWKNGCSHCLPGGRKSTAANMLSHSSGGDSRPRKVSPPSVGATLDDIREEAPTTPGAESTARNFAVPNLSDYYVSSGRQQSPVSHTYVNLVKSANSYSQPHQRIPNSSNAMSSSVGGANVYVNLLPNGFQVPPRISIPGMENTSLPEEVLNPRRNYALMNFSRSHALKSSQPSHSQSSRKNSIRPATNIGSPCSGTAGMSGNVNYTDIIPGTMPSQELSRGQQSTISTGPLNPVNTNYITVMMNPDCGLNSSSRNPYHTRASFGHPSSTSSGYGSVGVQTTPHLNYATIDGRITHGFSLLVMGNDKASCIQSEASCQPVNKNEEGTRNVLSKLSIFSRSSRR